jgi:hypothetical protein
MQGLVSVSRFKNLYLIQILQPDQAIEHLKNVVRSSLEGTLDESRCYGVANEMLFEHKQLFPRESFIIFPQLRLLWNPRVSLDRQCDVTDIGIGRLLPSGGLLLQGGLEQKLATPEMKNLPDPFDAVNIPSVKGALNRASIQASDQVKSAIKNGFLPQNVAIKWIVAAGPYFVIQTFGPFIEDELSTRGHKPNPSGDFNISSMIQNMKDSANISPVLETPHLIGTQKAAKAVQNYLISSAALYNSTDREPFFHWYVF